jgi:hypothetical protein
VTVKVVVTETDVPVAEHETSHAGSGAYSSMYDVTAVAVSAPALHAISRRVPSV